MRRLVFLLGAMCLSYLVFVQGTALVGRKAVFGDSGLGQPCGEGVRCSRHRSPSRATTRKVVYSVAVKG